MTVRIRFRTGRPLQKRQGKNRHLAHVAAVFCKPAALMAYVLGFWRLAADLGFAARFAISDPVFSHWQVWIPVAGVLHYASVALNRYGRGDDVRFPRSLTLWLPLRANQERVTSR